MSEQATPAVARRRREREPLRSMVPARYPKDTLRILSRIRIYLLPVGKIIHISLF